MELFLYYYYHNNDWYIVETNYNEYWYILLNNFYRFLQSVIAHFRIQYFETSFNYKVTCLLLKLISKYCIRKWYITDCRKPVKSYLVIYISIRYN
jgi:hypothetical protein